MVPNRLAGVALAAVSLLGATPPPGHVDAPALEEAVVEATRAFLRGDAAAARAALDKAEASCRRITHEDVPAPPRAIVNDDLALHAALDRAREFASRGEIDKASESLVWVGRTCRECHARSESPTGELPGRKVPPVKSQPAAVPN